jgi:hypothetical protein
MSSSVAQDAEETPPIESTDACQVDEILLWNDQKKRGRSSRESPVELTSLAEAKGT